MSECHRVGTDIDCENTRQQLNPVFQPLAAVLKASADKLIGAAEKGAPYTAADAVIVRRGIERDLDARRVL